jgi:hypothetical protein
MLLNYVVPSRVHDVACSPGKVIVSLEDIIGQSRTAQPGGSHRFHVCEFSWVQGVSDACRTCSAVLCVAVLLFRERRKEV